MANEIEIVVKVKDQASGDIAAIAEKVKASAGKGGGEGIKIPVEPDTSRFDQALGESVSDAEGKTRDLRRAMDDVGSTAEEAGRGLEDAGNAADGAGSKAASSGNGFDLAKLKLTGLIAGALALAPALAAIPAVTAAVVVGAGAMSLGFGGVISALKDYGQQSTASGQSGAQLAQTEFSNAVAIRNAQQAIVDARKQAAQAAQQSADQIHSAQEQVANSAYSLQQANQTLTDSEKSLTDAQKALTQAQLDAANQQKDLNNSAADSAIAVQQAQLNLAEAQDKVNTINSNGAATDDQRKQAQIDLLSATQALKDAQQRQVETQQAADAANKSGIDGMAGVVSAQNAVQKASEGVASAQHGVAQATQAQQDAQAGLARAVQASALQQANSAEAIQKAVQNLADTYEQQRLAAAAAASSGSSAANAFAKDMANLTPAGRAFVNQLLAMKSNLNQLKDTAQTSMLPGFEPLLAAIKVDMPGINTAIGQMGGAIGGFATNLGHLLQNPVFRGDLSKIFKDGLGFANQFGDGVLKMLSGVANAVSQAGPIVQGLGAGFNTLMSSGIPALFQGLSSNASGIGTLFQSLLTLVSNLAGPIGTISGAVATALAPAVKVLASPQVALALQSIANSIAQILIVLSPVITMLAQGLAGALRILAPLLQSTAKFIQDNSNWLVPLAKVAAAAAVAWWGLNIAMAANPLILIATLIAGLVIGLIYAWEHFKAFRDFIKEWWPELLAPFTMGVSIIIGHWNDIVAFIKLLPGRLASAGEHAWDWVGDKWDEAYAWVTRKIDGFVDTISGLPGKLASRGGHLFDWIPASFKWAINTVIGWWDSLSFGIPSIHIPGTDINVGGGSIGVPQIPYFARGGALPSGLTAAIGDGGWEPLRMPDGTVVIPHANAHAAIADGALGGGGSGKLEIELVSSGAEDYFMRFLRHAIRVRGGNVQKVLGVN